MSYVNTSILQPSVAQTFSSVKSNETIERVIFYFHLYIKISK